MIRRWVRRVFRPFIELLPSRVTPSGGAAFGPPPPSSALSPEIPGLNGPYDPAAPIDPLAPLVPTSVDDGTRLG